MAVHNVMYYEMYKMAITHSVDFSKMPATVLKLMRLPCVGRPTPARRAPSSMAVHAGVVYYEMNKSLITHSVGLIQTPAILIQLMDNVVYYETYKLPIMHSVGLLQTPAIPAKLMQMNNVDLPMCFIPPLQMYYRPIHMVTFQTLSWTASFMPSSISKRLGPPTTPPRTSSLLPSNTCLTSSLNIHTGRDPRRLRASAC